MRNTIDEVDADLENVYKMKLNDTPNLKHRAFLGG